MDAINQILETISGWLWGWPMIILLLGTHIYLTFILRFPQRKIFTAIRLSVKRDPNASGDVSQFRSLATALAATIGTGNIIGVATAVALGGPGAVLWCWLTGVFGISTKYAEGLLAIKYRTKTADGKMLGGPMYALERGLGWKWLAVLFAIFTACASFGIGNTVQANAIATLTFESYGISPYITGIFVCLLTGAVVLGGVKSIARVCDMLVPFMAMAVPLADTAYAFIRRIVRGQSPFHPDRGHFHHRLLDMGLTQTQAVYVMYGISMILGLLAYLMIGKNQSVKIVLLSVAVFISLVIILYVFFIYPRRQARRNVDPDLVDKDIKIYEKKGRK